MTRKLERRLMCILGAWQIILGLLTIFLYAPTYRQHGLEVEGLSIFQAEALFSVFGGIYMFIVSFGMIFIIIGLVNCLIVKKLNVVQIEKKIPIYLMVTGILSYLGMDIIGGILSLMAGILMLSKNKAIRKLNEAS